MKNVRKICAGREVWATRNLPTVSLVFSSTWGGRRTTIFWIKGTWRFQDFGTHCFRYSLEPIRSDQGRCA